MAISDTIQSMYENVGNVYDVLELAGADLTNVDKNIENLKQSWEERLLYFLANGTDVVWNNWLPKVNGTGESITLNNTIQAKMDFIYKGNTSQESTTGKNLFNINATPNRIGGDTTYSVSGNTLNVSGKWFVAYLIDVEENKDYYVSADKQVISGASAGSIAIYSANMQTTISLASFANFTFNSRSNTQVNVVLYCGTNSEGEVNFSNLQFEKGTTGTSYEPYTGGNPAPNPDYPYPVNVVTGDNEVKVEGKNLAYTGWAEDFVSRINNDNIAKLETKDNKNCLRYTANAGYNDYDNKYLFKTNWKENTQYTIKCSILNDASQIVNNYNIQIYYTDGTTTPIFLSNQQNAWISFSYTSAPNKTIKYITSAYYAGRRWLDLDTFMVYEGTDNANYVPYQSQTYPINLGSMELCKIGDYQDYIRKSTGKNLVNVVSTNEITYTGYGNFTLNNGVITTSGLTLTGFKVKVEPNTQYTAQLFATFTSGTNALRIREFNSEPTDWNTGYIVQNAVSIKNNDISNLTVTTSATTQWLLFVIYSDASGLVCKKIQLEKGSTATNWEPFGTGWYKYGAIGKAVYDGDENWTYENSESTPTERTVFRVETFTAGTNPNYISNRFIYNSQSPNRFVLIPNNNRPYMSIDNNLVNISTSDSSETKVSKLKTFVSSNNIVIYYVLNTPTITEITDTALINQLEAIKLSYNEQTNISQTNADKPFILDVTALKDLDAEDTTPALTTNRGLPFTQPPVSENFINDEDDNNILEETTNEEEPNIEDDNKEEEEPLDFFEKEIINNDEEQGEIPTEPIEIDNGQR